MWHGAQMPSAHIATFVWGCSYGGSSFHPILLPNMTESQSDSCNSLSGWRLTQTVDEQRTWNEKDIVKTNLMPARNCEFHGSHAKHVDACISNSLYRMRGGWIQHLEVRVLGRDVGCCSSVENEGNFTKICGRIIRGRASVGCVSFSVTATGWK